MAEGSGIDMSKVSTGEKIVLGGAGLFVIWTLLPVWYKSDLGSLGGFRSSVILAWLLAVIAIVEIVLRSMMGMKIDLPVRPGLLHLGIAGLAVLFTLIGVFSRPSGYGISWGAVVAILVTLAWAYGAYIMYSEPETARMSPPADGQGNYTS
jgi:hypothetical protein